MDRATPAPRLRPSSRWWAIVFALGVLGVGMAAGRLTFALDPHVTTRIGLDAVPVPAWVFTGVWLVAYPSMGIATWLVWRTRGAQDVSVPLAVFSAAVLQTLSFWLTSSLQMTAVIDATGLLLSYTVAWVYSRYWKAAVWWLLPWLVWMPITLGLKLWVIRNGVA